MVVALHSRQPAPGHRGPRISQHFRLGTTQPGLDFVDVTVHGDDPLFVDPQALRELPSAWGQECVALLQSFFGEILRSIRVGQELRARRLLAQLREPNETHLGLSRGRAQGRALGPGLSRSVGEALAASEAVRTGLLEDLEETVLMIEGISHDIVSDITTNVIRQPLIRFTQQQVEQHGIPTRLVDSGPLWDPERLRWFNQLRPLPCVSRRRLLLVPKVIVRRQPHYRDDEYLNHYVLEALRERELQTPNSELVHLLKDGTPRVTKKDLKAKYGQGKRVAAHITRADPTILDRYRERKARRRPTPLTHAEFAELLPGVPEPDWDALVAAITRVPPGAAGADAFHRAVEALLKALFHPGLAMPRREVRLHGGRKRIDLAFTNQAQSGFFAWVAQHYPAPNIFVECKNYASDPANPELDQLAGRFAPSRGQVGLLVRRTIADRQLFLERCRDTALDHRGYILALDDQDLQTLAAARKADDHAKFRALLQERFNALIE
jgi:hypothetical protein